MAYTPQNQTVYIKAFAGALAGLGAAGKYLTDLNTGDFLSCAQNADAFAQEVDVQWARLSGASPTTLELLAIEDASEAIWQKCSPLTRPASLSAGNYFAPALGVVALALQGNVQVVSEGISPNIPVGAMVLKSQLFTSSARLLNPNGARFFFFFGCGGGSGGGGGAGAQVGVGSGGGGGGGAGALTSWIAIDIGPTPPPFLNIVVGDGGVAGNAGPSENPGGDGEDGKNSRVMDDTFGTYYCFFLPGSPGEGAPLAGAGLGGATAFGLRQGGGVVWKRFQSPGGGGDGTPGQPFGIFVDTADGNSGNAVGIMNGSPTGFPGAGGNHGQSGGLISPGGAGGGGGAGWDSGGGVGGPGGGFDNLGNKIPGGSGENAEGVNGGSGGAGGGGGYLDGATASRGGPGGAGAAGFVLAFWFESV